LSGEAIGRLFKLSQNRHVIGRAESATIKLFDEGVAARHVELYQEGGDVVLAVLNEEVETYVNGKPVQQRTLTNGDRIQLGTVVTLKYTSPGPLTQSKSNAGVPNFDNGANASAPTHSGVRGSKPERP
jgi:pSer/pThr/pTyr-binding forkhead associated (FHA) protein